MVPNTKKYVIYENTRIKTNMKIPFVLDSSNDNCDPTPIAMITQITNKMRRFLVLDSIVKVTISQ